jgi:hypothetical protein
MHEEDKKCSGIFNGKVEKTRPFCVRRRTIGQEVRVSRRLSVKVKWPGREVDHSPVSSADVTNAWSCTSTSQHSFMACTGTNFS